jgi:sugar lactone lactonase YvrE
MASRFWMGMAIAALLTGSNCGRDVCSTSGSGEVAVTFAGLPPGATGTVRLNGASAQTISSAQTLNGLRAGTWAVSADKVTQADSRVRTVYAPAVSRRAFCLANGSTETVDVSWAAVPTSNKLWVLNAGGGTGQLLGFPSSSLATSGTVFAGVSAKAPSGRDLAFDPDGNLWTMGPTSADPALVRLNAASGMTVKDRGIDIEGLNCLPGLAGLAFDSSGNLYVGSPCKETLWRLSADQLNATTPVTPTVIATGIKGIGGLAFDAVGNLWVADADSKLVLRFDSAQLTTPSIGAPSLRLGARASDLPADSSLLTPSWLAFDAAGNLWGNDFGANVFFRFSDLTGSGEKRVNPAVRISVSVSALLEGFAFDESGGLWTAFSAGKIARLGPAQLTSSSGPGAPTTPETVITSSDLGHASNIALYPAPAGTPLFHRLP